MSREEWSKETDEDEFEDGLWIESRVIGDWSDSDGSCFQVTYKYGSGVRFVGKVLMPHAAPTPAAVPSTIGGAPASRG